MQTTWRSCCLVPVHNADVTRVFDEIADLLELQAANPFRVRAYRRASRLLGGLDRSVRTMVERGDDLDALPGIGVDLAGKIAEIVTTGSCALLKRLRAEVPANLGELLKVPRLGPKRVRALHEELGIETLAQLHAAAQAGRVRSVHGFGARLQQLILAETGRSAGSDHRVRLNVADEVAASLLAHLRSVPGVRRVELAGSARRRKDSIGDIDLLAQCAHGLRATDALVHHEDVRQVLARGPARASVVLRNGMQVDLRVVDEASFGAAWVYFTGSKAHNIALRQLARRQGLKINEYGVFRGDLAIAGRDEASVYRAVGLQLVPPELREDRGELDAAREARLPVLVERGDLRGDLHAHTVASDGHDDIEALASAARAHGLQYLAITDHWKRLALVHGLDAGRLSQQIDRIDRLNASFSGFALLKGIEIDILENGDLGLPDELLQRLDLVVAAVHHRFDLPRERQTERLLRAMDHKHFSVLAHPSARLIAERPPIEIDLPRVMRHAAGRGCFVELNAQPARLDIDDLGCALARAEGVLVSIDSDAHSTLEFDNLRFGIDQARRGGLSASDVLNTRSLDELKRLLARTM